MATRILVTGGTGTVGRLLTARLQAAGHTVTAASRRTGVDLVSRTGLDAALREAPIVIHCASDTAHSGRGDGAATRNLVAAADRAGCPHLVFISIVGVDRNPFPYYRRKYAAERVVEAGRTPWTILRTTQFHELFDEILQRLMRSPVVPTSNSVKVQPIAAAEVAERLADLALAGPQGRADDLGGPQILTVRQLFATYLAVTGRRRLLVPVPLPGKTGRAFRDGAAAVPDRLGGRQTWRQYVESR